MSVNLLGTDSKFTEGDNTNSTWSDRSLAIPYTSHHLSFHVQVFIFMSILAS